jgi:AraC-like DNA-binding protein
VLAPPFYAARSMAEGRIRSNRSSLVATKNSNFVQVGRCASVGSSGTPPASPRVTGNEPASQRDRLRSGFRDYTHFARKFRRRFGYPLGAHSESLGHSGDGTVRTGTSEGTSLAHDV